MMLLELIYKISVGLRREKSEVRKSSEFAKDCGAIKCRFRETKDKLDINIIVKYLSKGKNYLKTLKIIKAGF